MSKCQSNGCYANVGNIAFTTNRLNNGARDKRATSVEVSQNKKVGPASVTYVAQQSCPASCVFLPKCLPKATVTPEDMAREEALAIDRLTGRFVLMLKGVGDCSTDGAARIVADAVKRFLARSATYGRAVAAWTYTHAWKPGKEAVKRESFGPISVLASCHTLEEVEQASDLDYATAITVDRMSKPVIKLNGRSFVHCLEQSKGTKCIDCRLCFDDVFLKRKRITIVFSLHPKSAAKRAYDAIKRAYGKVLSL